MLFSIGLLIVIVFLAFKASPVEKKEHAVIHGAGQIGLLAAVALFGVDYFTSFFYGTGELMSALHPYGLQKYGYVAAVVIALANIVFGALYMFSLGPFNEGGGSYTASMRYLKPTLSLIVAVTLIEDYVLTIVVSALSGADQLLSILNAYNTQWIWHFAIGAFLAFTLSQAGMVMHWKRLGGEGANWRMAVNGIGAVATGITLVVVLVAKFTTGAWITAILVPALMSVMVAVRHHYDGVAREVAVEGPMRMENLAEPLIIIPVDRWSRISEKALRFAMKLSDQVQAVHVDAEECYEEVSRNWQQNVGGPFARAGRAVPELVFLESPYRFVLTPLLDYIGKVERECPDRQIAVLVPELVVKHWWQTPLHNQRARMLKMLLTVQRNHRIMVISLPWYL